MLISELEPKGKEMSVSTDHTLHVTQQDDQDVVIVWCSSCTYERAVALEQLRETAGHIRNEHDMLVDAYREDHVRTSHTFTVQSSGTGFLILQCNNCTWRMNLESTQLDLSKLADIRKDHDGARRFKSNAKRTSD